MISYEKLATIPFPTREEIDEVKDNVTCWELPLGARFFYEGDILQVVAILKNDNHVVAVANQDNCIILLRYVLSEVLFKKEWYYSHGTRLNMNDDLGLSDYYWFLNSIEMQYCYIDELDLWCQQVWKILREESVIEKLSNDHGDKVFYLVKGNSIEDFSSEQMICVYQRLLPVFLQRINEYCSEEPDIVDSDTQKEYLEHVQSVIANRIAMVKSKR